MTRGAVDKSGITRSDIDALVARFYAEIRRDAALGPIFEGRIGTDDAAWRRHLSKIGDFWANVMLHERAYQGNPMRVHMAITDIRPDHFARWLDLFEKTARETLAAHKADAFDTLARRIGASLSMGLEQMRHGRVPLLHERAQSAG